VTSCTLVVEVRTRKDTREAALHRDERVTILLITHRPDIAARARRQLTLCDGVLSG